MQLESNMYDRELDPDVRQISLQVAAIQVALSCYYLYGYCNQFLHIKIKPFYFVNV